MRVFLLLVLFVLSCCAQRNDTLELKGFGDTNLWFSHFSPPFTPNKGIEDEVIYEVFVDRFAGFKENMNGWTEFWGGNLKGVIGKTSYLKDLGVTTLWLTPITELQPVRVHGKTGYHGYWPRDLYRVDPKFGTLDEFHELSRNFRIYLDLVLNHSSPTDPDPTGEPTGEVRKDGVKLFDYSDTKAYHHFGGIQDWNDKFQLENYMLSNLADLNQDDPRVRTYLFDAVKFWLKNGASGFRMDALKHIPFSFWKDLSAQNPETPLIGEWFGGGPWDEQSWKIWRETGVTLFDFSFRGAIEGGLLQEGGDLGGTFLRLWSDRDQKMGGHKNELVTFLNNHDFPRLAFGPLDTVAFTLLFTTRGVPCLYYGDETGGMDGSGADPYNRWGLQEAVDQRRFQTVKSLVELRLRNRSLRFGDTHVLHATKDILAFERVWGSYKVFVVVSKNPANDSFPIQGLTIKDGQYRNILGGEELMVNDGVVWVNLSKGKAIVIESK